jgi:hypothetical protein
MAMGKRLYVDQQMKYGYGYEHEPKPGETGFHWYAVAFDKRSEAHKECEQELSWTSQQLYTQGHVTIFGFNFKVPFTRRAVEWSEASAAKGEAMLINALKENMNARLGELICRYDDCGGGRKQRNEHEQVTCPTCREWMGLGCG